MKFKGIYILLILIFVMAACSTNPPVEEKMNETAQEMEMSEMSESEEMEDEMIKEVSFANDLLPILDKFASPGHSASSAVSLATYEDVLKVVVPGSPEESSLYKRLIGDGVPVMPPSGKLDDEIIELFYDWIKAGAKDN